MAPFVLITKQKKKRVLMDYLYYNLKHFHGFSLGKNSMGNLRKMTQIIARKRLNG